VVHGRSHLVYTWDNSSLGKFYYNGGLENGWGINTTPLPRIAFSRCSIARNVSTGNSPVKGRLRDFRIYGTALRYSPSPLMMHGSCMRRRLTWCA
jgi:hypothetical protein